jgi:hypothetical protein
MAEIDEGVMEGYLLLADISGYTTFLTGTELEHSHAIVTELTKLIRATLSPPMQFVKLEGDAVLPLPPNARPRTSVQGCLRSPDRGATIVVDRHSSPAPAVGNGAWL